MSELTLVFHGGRCCGIKTIYGFVYAYPGFPYGEPAKEKKRARGHDAHYSTYDCEFEFFTDEAPKENTEARLDRYLDFLRKKRPFGIVEVVLAYDPTLPYLANQSSWVVPLEKRGFVLVSEGRNSNSGNICHVFHLVMK